MQDYQIMQHVKWTYHDYVNVNGDFGAQPYDESRVAILMSNSTTSHYYLHIDGRSDNFAGIIRAANTSANLFALTYQQFGSLLWRPLEYRAASALTCRIWYGHLDVSFDSLRKYLKVEA